MSIKKFVVVAALAFALVAGASAVKAASFDLGSTTLKLGSSGLAVQNLQANLNAVANDGLVVDGRFGHGTQSAVEAFQQSHGLTADGLVGNMTKAALANAGGMSSTSCPAGFTCTSTTPVTTVTCPVGFTCVSNSTGSTASTTGPLSINQVTGGSGYSNTNVGVGSSNKQVADLRIVTGAGGAGNLTGMNVTFTNTNSTSDYQFIKYASNVSVWYNGAQVGSLPATSFTNYNSQYSAYIPLSGAMLNPNTTSDLYIAVSALPVIDSSNYTNGNNNNWKITGTSLRYSDSTGSAFQYSIADSQLANSNFQFSAAASANSIKLTVTKDVTDSSDRTVQVSASSNTQSLTLATIDLSAQGSNVNLQRLPVTVAVGNTSATDVSQVMSTLRLFNSAGQQIDSETIPTGFTTACSSTSGTQTINGVTYSTNFTGASANVTGGAACGTITFQNLNGGNNGINGITIPAGSTQIFTIKADVNTLTGGSFTAGTYAVAEVTPTNMLAAQAYDVNNNLLPQNTTYLVGSTTGSRNYFYVNTIGVASTGTPVNSYSNPGGTQSHGVFSMSIPFSVTAYGTTAYVPSSPELVSAGTVNNPTASPDAHIQYAIDNGSALLSSGSATLQYAGSDTMTVDGNGNYQIPVGQSKNFVLTVTFQPSVFGSYRAQLVNVNWNNTDSGSSYTVYTAGLNAQAFKTNYAAGQ